MAILKVFKAFIRPVLQTANKSTDFWKFQTGVESGLTFGCYVRTKNNSNNSGCYYSSFYILWKCTYDLFLAAWRQETSILDYDKSKNDQQRCLKEPLQCKRYSQNFFPCSAFTLKLDQHISPSHQSSPGRHSERTQTVKGRLWLSVMRHFCSSSTATKRYVAFDCFSHSLGAYMEIKNIT